MDAWLLATKLCIPPQAPRALRRERLVDALERNIPDYKLIQVSAPAGYGKTTLLAQWASSSRYPIAWVSIGDEDNDVERLLRDLSAAWVKKHPQIRDTPLGLLLSGMSPDSKAVLSAFLNVADDTPDVPVFVLDDFHLIQEPAVHQALTFLLDHSPPNLHFVLAGRAEPPLPLARYRAHHELLELDAEDLRFTAQETANFLSATMQLDLSGDAITTLQAQAEGWIAGLQLAGLALQRRGSVTDAPIISGKQRFIADYLSEDVVAHLPVELRQFLLQTSILDRLCVPLCNAVTGNNDGQELLEALERENLFLVPLDDNRQWFRYHYLFAEFLHGELERRYAEEVPELHRRAAQWYLLQDLAEEAFPHAVASGDVELVIQILDRHTIVRLLGGEFNVVQRWLQSLPAEWQSTHAMIAITRASLLIFTGQFEEGIRFLDRAEQLALAQGRDSHGVRARVTAIRCFIACYQNELAPAETLARQALEALPKDALDLRHGIFGSLGDTYRRNGRWEEAKVCYLKALEPPFGLAHRIGSVHAFGALADLELRQGRLRGAAAYWRKALAVFQDHESWGRFPLPLLGWVYIRTGEILYEWDELQEASDHVFRGLERAELGGDAQALIAGYLIAGRLKLTAGEMEAASEYIGRVSSLVENAPFPDRTSRLARLEVEYHLAKEQVRAAVDRVEQILGGSAQESGPGSELAQLAMARVLIAKGDAASVQRAHALLTRGLERAEAEGRLGVLIEALALQSLAHWRRGERAEAMTALERCLRLAEPEGYIHLLIDFGLPMARLLQEARARNVMPEYVEKLMAAFGHIPALPDREQDRVPEPLSPRELQVLHMIAAGLTNREIAGQLVISSETVKKHTSTILSKLGVSNRSQAAAKARELHLLD